MRKRRACAVHDGLVGRRESAGGVGAGWTGKSPVARRHRARQSDGRAARLLLRYPAASAGVLRLSSGARSVAVPSGSWHAVGSANRCHGPSYRPLAGRRPHGASLGRVPPSPRAGSSRTRVCRLQLRPFMRAARRHMVEDHSRHITARPLLRAGRLINLRRGCHGSESGDRHPVVNGCRPRPAFMRRPRLWGVPASGFRPASCRLGMGSVFTAGKPGG